MTSKKVPDYISPSTKLVSISSGAGIDVKGEGKKITKRQQKAMRDTADRQETSYKISKEKPKKSRKTIAPRSDGESFRKFEKKTGKTKARKKISR